MRQMEQIQENCKAGGKTKRLANFELLRCIAMMMVVVLHFLGKAEFWHLFPRHPWQAMNIWHGAWRAFAL